MIEMMRLAPGSLPSAIRTLDVEARTVELVWSTGAEVLRNSPGVGHFYEVLSMSPAHIRLGRLNAGASFLDSHRQFGLESRLGGVVPGSAVVKGGEGRCVVKLSRSPLGDRVLSDLADGIRLSVSVGYKVHRFERTDGEDGELPTMRAIDWEPMEVSAVTIPADAGAMARQVSPQTYEAVVERAVAAADGTGVEMEADELEFGERERRVSITELAQRHSWPAKKRQRAIADGLSVNEVRSAILDDLTSASERRAPMVATVSGIDDDEALGDRTETLASALYARIDPSHDLAPQAQQYRHLSLAATAALCLEQRGLNTRGESASRIFSRALTSTDFPLILGSLMNRSLRAGYDGVDSEIKRIGRKVTAKDFRARHSIVVTSDFELMPRNENGEYLSASIAESKESFRVQTYGRVFRVTRETLVNDDLSFFDRVPRIFGRKSAEKESAIIAGLLTGTTTLSDGKPLFHADHRNIGVSAKLSHEALSAASVAMARQQSGTEKVVVRPRYLIVPPELTMSARQILATVAATTVENVNVWAGKLQIIEEPTLQDPKAWYLAADPSEFDTLEYAYLEGEEGLVTETAAMFETDQVAIKARLDFGAGLMDHRGFWYNAGQ